MDSNAPSRYVDAIRRSGLTIYDPIEIGDAELWIPTPQLEELLQASLSGISLAGLPLRTRSKVVKEHVCRALGYTIPPSFKRVRPRFPGQDFDTYATYAQKSANLQIWNEGLAPERRYALFRIGEDNVIAGARVVTGTALAQLDTTGTLTRKYQARLIFGESKSELAAAQDTDLLQPFVRAEVDFEPVANPAGPPREGRLLTIQKIFERLQPLVGESFPDAGHDQERNRGAALHRLVCRQLGYADYKDDGRFSDVRHQLLEVKLQTALTIDLGLARPNSEEALDAPKIGARQIRYCDVRYALFHAATDGRNVTLTHIFLTTGEKFFTRFPEFQDKVLNKKIQISLPADFWGSQSE